MIIGNKEFDTKKHTYIMGILNVTPDSFSDGGRYQDIDAALRHAEEMVRDGADILDVGGESTRPGHVQITDEEEIGRTAPVIERLKQEFDVPISIDTYKGSVAHAALQAGADLVNDVWGLKYDSRMAKLIKDYGASCCLMHNRNNTEYADFVKDVVTDLEKCLVVAEKYGVKKEKIILDPGIGFGKTYEQNLMMMNHLEDICGMGYPVLLGTSRKSMIGITLDLPVEEREEGTIATTVMGAMKGCDFVRVHDVKANLRALQMTEAIYHS